MARKWPLFGVHGGEASVQVAPVANQVQPAILPSGDKQGAAGVVTKLASMESRGTSPIGFSDDVPLKYLICHKYRSVSTLTDPPKRISSAIQTDHVADFCKSVMVKESCVQVGQSFDDVSTASMQRSSASSPDDVMDSVFSRTTSNLLKAASSINASSHFDLRLDGGDLACEDYLHRNTPPVLTKMVDINTLCSSMANPSQPINTTPALPFYSTCSSSFIVPQPTDGLQLLGILAEHLQRNSTSEERQSVSPDINKNYNAPKSFCFDDKDFIQSKTNFLKKSEKDEDAVFQPQWTSNIFKINTEPDNMDAMELDYRVRLAEIQRKYKEKQKQLAKLHHKKSDDRHSSRRKPGRPKRRGSQKSTSSCKSDDVAASSDNTSSDQNIKKKSHSKRSTSEVVIKKEPQKVSQKPTSNKQTSKAKNKPITPAEDKPVNKATNHLSDNCHNTSGLGLLAQYATCQVESINTDSQVVSTETSLNVKRKKKQGDGSSQDEDDDVPAKKRKPGRPKKFDEESVTETIVAKKPKNLNFFSYGNSKGYGSAFRRTHTKTGFASKATSFVTKASTLGSKSASLVNKFSTLGSKSSVTGAKCNLLTRPPSSSNRSPTAMNQPSVSPSKSLLASKCDVHGGQFVTLQGKASAELSKSPSALGKSESPAGSKSSATPVKSDAATGSRSAALQTKSDAISAKPSVISKPDVSGNIPAVTLKSDILGNKPSQVSKSDLGSSKSSQATSKTDIAASKMHPVTGKSDVLASTASSVFSKPDVSSSQPLKSSVKSDSVVSKSLMSTPSSKSDAAPVRPASITTKFDIAGGKPTLMVTKPEVPSSRPPSVVSRSGSDAVVGKPASLFSKSSVTGNTTSNVTASSSAVHVSKPSTSLASSSSSSTSKASITVSKSTTASSETTQTSSAKEEPSTPVCSTISYRRRSERIFISESLQTAKASNSSVLYTVTPATTSTTPSDETRTDDTPSQPYKAASGKQSSTGDHPGADKESSGRQSAANQCTRASSTSKDQSNGSSHVPSKNKNSKDTSKAQITQDLTHRVKKKSTSTKTGSTSTETEIKTETPAKQTETSKPKTDSKEKSATSSSVVSICSQSDSDSSSDVDSLPLSTLIQQTASHEVISCKLTKKDLKNNLSVLFFKEGLFYEANVVTIQPPDIYGVLIEGERGSRPHILPTEELLEKAVLDVKCTSPKSLPPGTRVCAYWSQQFSCLYPGSISKDGPSTQTEQGLICVEFDDGDSGKIPMEHIRLLPADFPIQDLETNPLMMIGNRKRKSTGDDTNETKKHRPSTSEGTGNYSSSGQPKNDSRPLSKSSKSKVSESDKKRVDASPGSRTCSKSVSKLKITSKVSSSVKTKVEPSLRVKGQSSVRSRERSCSVHSAEKTSHSHRSVSHMVSSSMAKSRRSHMVCNNQSDSSNDDSAATSSQSGDSDSSTESGDDDEYIPAKNKSQARTSYRDEKCQNKVISPRKRQQESNDQMVPLQQLWQWVGKGTKRPGMKGKAKREYFKSIQRGSEIINVGDCAVFLSAGRTLPYVGRIVSLWQGWGGNMVVKVKWFYHPEETKGGKKLAEIRGALYQSPHVDENDVQTISHKCELLSYVEWKAYRARKQQESQRKGVPCELDDDVYYLAGTYDPTMGMITFQPDVKLL